MRQARIKASHNEYLASHPELKTLVSDFMAALLMEKPDDPVEFARVHFERYADAASAEAAALVAAGVDLDTFLSCESLSAARHASGAVCAATWEQCCCRFGGRPSCEKA